MKRLNVKKKEKRQKRRLESDIARAVSVPGGVRSIVVSDSEELEEYDDALQAFEEMSSGDDLDLQVYLLIKGQNYMGQKHVFGPSDKNDRNQDRPHGTLHWGSQK